MPPPPPSCAREPALTRLLRSSLGQVQAALEAWPDDRSQQAECRRQLDHDLRELHGGWAITGAFAGPRLIEEMRALLAVTTEAGERACTALDDAALLLERVLDDPLDTPRLRTALNALRAARGAATLSAAELFAARAIAETWPNRLPAAAIAGVAGESATAFASRELAGFQAAFLAWFRNPAADEALARLATLASAVASRVDDDRLRACWQAHAAFADSLIGRRIDSLDARRLLGRAGSQLKTLAERGEAAALAQTGDTLWLLLHALQEAGATGSAAALLARLLPADAAAADRAPPLPDRASGDAARTALLQELAELRDAIDLHQRGSRTALAGCQPRLLRAAAVAELLGDVGAAASLRQLGQAIDAAGTGTALADWLPIAGRLLRLEAALAPGQRPDDDRADGATPLASEWRAARTALLRELRADAARVRSLLEHPGLDSGSPAQPPTRPLLRPLAAALQMLGSTAEADAVAVLAAHLDELPAAMRPAAAAPAIAALEAWLDAAHDHSPRSGRLAQALRDAVLQLPSPAAEPAPAPPSLPLPPAASEELKPLFAGEAAEVLAALAALRPVFIRAPGDTGTRAALLRAFHTLTGSGRSVGATALGELAAACEALLQPSIDPHAASRPETVAALTEAIDAVPGVIDRWQAGAALADPALAALIARLAALAATAAAPAPDLRSVFCQDSRARLAGLRDWLAQADRHQPEVTVDAALSRSFHTLKGAAAIVNAVALSRLAGLLEAALDPAPQQQRRLPAEALPQLDALVATLARWVDAVADEQPVPEDAADGYAGQIAAWSVPTPAQAPADAMEASEQAAAPPITAPAAASPPIDGDATVDAELRDIFLGEAQELLDALAVSSGLWAGQPEERRSLGNLRRSLHTLKGSARMAAATAIGTVAHRLESLLERPDAAPAAVLLAALDHGIDGLQRLLDGWRRGEPLPAAPVLAAIEATLGSPGDLPAALAAAATVDNSRPDDRTGDAGTEAAASPAGSDECPDALAGDRPPPLRDWLPGLFPMADDDSPAAAPGHRETARVPVEQLDAMLDQAGEIAIARGRLDEQQAALKAQLAETTQTIGRIRDQLRQLDIETDAQISARSSQRASHGAAAEDRYAAEFDALEMDRYSRMQELSRALAESVGDLVSLHASMDDTLASADSLLVQQARQTTELQQGLMGTLMVPFARQEPRLSRLIRQTALDRGRDVEPVYVGADAELDRKLLERMTAPLEHLLRNAVVHGIEAPALRVAAGKPARGTITVTLARDGAQLRIEVADDGRGFDLAAIRSRAIASGRLSAAAEISDPALARLILEPGFSTAGTVTEDAGRGIGMDVVANTVRQLGGTLALHADPGRGARFTIHLPLALALSQALLVGVGDETFAIPLAAIDGVGRLPREQAATLLAGEQPQFRWADQDWPLRHLGEFVDLPAGDAADGRHLHALLLRLDGDGADGRPQRLALRVDRVLGNREIVSKGAGPQLGAVPGIGGATLLADGRPAMILDLPALIADRLRRTPQGDAGAEHRLYDRRATVLVVDDSITIRRVAERLLLRHGYRVLSARDGVEAMALLHTETPAAVLLDIEMPRADGFEVAAFIRQQARLAGLPIVMITSRSGDKHRARARQLGVDRYLTKPWQDDQLLATLRSLPGMTP
jgi:chemosensory pili system protein ChpA (sensor histidine kinase/response regulator)